MGFKKFLTESTNPNGEEWEVLICHAWNMLHDNNIEQPTSNSYESTIDKLFNDNSEKSFILAKNLSEYIKSNDKMIHNGSGKGMVSSNWKGGNNTPKTDMFVGNYNISLKKIGGSQIMSAKRNEAVSTLESAILLAGEHDTTTIQKLSTRLMNQLGDSMDTGMGSLTNLKKEKDNIKLNRVQNKILKQDETNKLLSKAVHRFFNNEKNDLFKMYFCYEAATGYNKFDDNKSVSNYIVEFDPSNGKIEFDELGVKGIPSKKIKELSSKVKITVSFKGSKGNVWSALKILKEEKNVLEYNSFESIVNNTFEELSVLSEGVFSNINDKIKAIVNKIKERLSKTIDSIVKMGKYAIIKLLEFFGFSIDSVTASNNVFID
jgi:hypothetical protein